MVLLKGALNMAKIELGPVGGSTRITVNTASLQQFARKLDLALEVLKKRHLKTFGSVNRGNCVELKHELKLDPAERPP